MLLCSAWVLDDDHYGSGSGGTPGGPSYFYSISQHIGKADQFSFLPLGHQAGGYTMGASGQGKKINTIRTPQSAFDQLFNGFVPPDDAAALAAAEKDAARRRNILEFARGETDRLRSRLSSEEAVKAEQILTSLEELGGRIQVMSAGQGCVVPNRYSGPTMNSSKHSPYYPQQIKANYDIAYHALACGLTHVVGLNTTSGQTKWSEATKYHDNDHHQIHHNLKKSQGGWNALRVYEEHFWEELGNFVRKLKNTPEGDGNMLDNTLVAAISKGFHHHGHQQYIATMFGNVKGHFTKGKYIHLPNKSELQESKDGAITYRPDGDVYLGNLIREILGAFGVPNASSFGDSSKGGSTLEQVKA